MVRFGRKKATLLLTIALVGSSVGVAFSPSYEVFVITRFLSGAFTIANFIAVFTYGKCNLKCVFQTMKEHCAMFI